MGGLQLLLVINILSIAAGLKPESDSGLYAAIIVSTLGLAIGYPLIFSKIKEIEKSK